MSIALSEDATTRPDPAPTVEQGRVKLGGVSRDENAFRELPAMASLCALLYGVDLLLRTSPVLPWFEFVIAGSILLLGRETLQRGFVGVFYRLQPAAETLVAAGALVAFFYSFVVSVLYTLGRLSSSHLIVDGAGQVLPSIYYTTAGSVMLAATLGREWLRQGQVLLAERRDLQRERLARDGGVTTDVLSHKAGWEASSPLLGLADRLGAYWSLAVLLLVFLSTAGALAGVSGLNAAVMGSIISFLICCSPMAFSRVTRAIQAWGSIRAGSYGFVIRNRSAMEILARIDAACFNKLGTLTMGSPRVTDVLPLEGGMPRSEIIYLASVLETPCDHPFREAILLEVAESERTMPRVRGFRYIPGRGIRAVFHGQEVVLGGPHYIAELGFSLESAQKKIEELSSEGKTVLLLARAGEVVGLLALKDETRPDAAETVKKVRDQGVRTVAMSGDEQRTVESVVEGMPFDEIHFGLTQQSCVDVVREIKRSGYRLCMVGGGVADASAFTQADLGVAFGVGREGLSRSADIILRGERLTEIPRVIELARRTRKWIVGIIGGLCVLQAALLSVVALWWLEQSSHRADDLASEVSEYIHRLGYWPDLVGVFMALLPALAVWAVYFVARRASTRERDPGE